MLLYNLTQPLTRFYGSLHSVLELTSASDPIQLLQDAKDAKQTRSTVEFDLNAVQASREQSDQALQTVIASKDGLQNFTLEAPPDLSKLKNGTSNRILGK